MSQLFVDRLQQLEIGPARVAGGLQILGLYWTPSQPINYLTLDEALGSGQFEVSEITEGGSVPTLTVLNKADTLIFLMAGEQLIGAKQNRVLNASILVPAQSQIPIPVSCVEAGRWSYRSRGFGSSGTASHGKLRKTMHSHSTKSYRAMGTPTSEQGEVWSEVSRKLDAMQSMSPSSALEQVYVDRSKQLEEIQQQLTVPERACGAVFAINGQICGVDLFDKHETLAKLWNKLLRAYALDALEDAKQDAPVLAAEQVRQWLQTAPAAKSQVFKSPGVGEDVRLESAQLVGAGLVLETQPIHVELFPGHQPA